MATNGLSKSEERDLRCALSRYQALEARKAHWGWTREWQDVVKEMDAIRQRLDPIPVSRLLERCEKLSPQFERTLRDIDARDACLEVMG